MINKKGFTLVELLISLLIFLIATLAIIAGPGRVKKELAKTSYNSDDFISYINIKNAINKDLNSGDLTNIYIQSDNAFVINNYLYKIEDNEVVRGRVSRSSSVDVDGTKIVLTKNANPKIDTTTWGNGNTSSNILDRDGITISINNRYHIKIGESNIPLLKGSDL